MMKLEKGTLEYEMARLLKPNGQLLRGKRSSGRIRAELNLRGMPAFNEYLPAPRSSSECVAEGASWRSNRNAAKARRRALRGAP